VKLRRLHVQNFKLLRDVEITFSADPNRPLTVVRAENGSGKTSLLYALLWGFYGSAGLPTADTRGGRNEGANSLRLSSTRWPTGQPCEISVRIEFEASELENYAGTDREVTTSYVLTRKVIETPTGPDSVSAERDSLVVHAHSDAGADRLEDAAARALIRRHAPEHLKDIFFTDGDSVQRFITGEISASARQQHVRDAIKALLGLNNLQMAEADLTKARTYFRRQRANAPGAGQLRMIEEQIEAKQDERQGLVEEAAALAERLNEISAAITRRQERLDSLRHLGELDVIRARKDTASRALATANSSLEHSKKEQRDLLRGDLLSWELMGDALHAGLETLETLADRRIIPGTSVEVLRARIELGECICGESLADGTPHRHAVEKLLDEQADVDRRKERLTELLYQARSQQLGRDSALAEGRSWIEELNAVEERRALAERQTRDQESELAACVESLRRLEDAQIDELLDQLERAKAQHNNFIRQEQTIALRLQDLDKQIAQLEQDAQKARKHSQATRDLDDRVDVAEDLLRLVAATLRTFEEDYLQLASQRMNELFMEIVGATDDIDKSIFSEVRLTPQYEIEVRSGTEGNTLDPDYEINGASKRALTLSFIWALMEVAGGSAPRIIDTPLGMMSGKVKERFVDLLTKPGPVDFQVVLLMTRSEIDSVEALLDERAGAIQTLTCNKDSEDLVNDWGSEPIVVACACTHRQSCDICVRKGDGQHHLEHRPGALMPA
jgi:DNA sulfur modification protein DndD